MSHKLPLKDYAFISDFAAFARARGDEKYGFHDPSNCAVAQFGYPDIYSTGHDTDGVQRVPVSVMDAACGHPWTWPALADRLEALLLDAPVVSI